MFIKKRGLILLVVVFLIVCVIWEYVMLIDVVVKFYYVKVEDVGKFV